MKHLGLVLYAVLAFSSFGIASSEADLKLLVTKMQHAILTQDKSAYLALMDFGDPIFAVEHYRFVEDWLKNPVKQLELGFVLLEESTNNAQGLLTWNYQNKDGTNIVTSYTVSFHKLEDRWLYAGEYWLELQTENIKIQYAPGLERQARQVLERLPEITKLVSDSLEFQNQHKTTIKIYASSESLTQSVGLSWTVFDGWNEPDEAIKVWTEPGYSIASSILAHEMTHNYAFERFGAHSFPWWLDEGLAEHVASKYWNTTRLENRRRTVTTWALNKTLEPWENLSDLSTTPTRLWNHVYIQGFALVQYITQSYGQHGRNQWLNEISSGNSLSDAAQIAFGKSFAQLDLEFRALLERSSAQYQTQLERSSAQYQTQLERSSAQYQTQFEPEAKRYFKSLGTSFTQRSRPLPTAHCTITTASFGLRGKLTSSLTLGLAPQTLYSSSLLALTSAIRSLLGENIQSFAVTEYGSSGSGLPTRVSRVSGSTSTST